MRIGYLTRRTVFLVPLVAAVPTLTTAAAPAAHSTLTPIAAPAGCPAAEIIGVHGTSEGPSSTDSTDSPEITATFTAFGLLSGKRLPISAHTADRHPFRGGEPVHQWRPGLRTGLATV
jgi:hypothetical protein